MKRRTMLKRLGAAGAGMAAVSGSANATIVPGGGTQIDDVPLDGDVVVENGAVYVYSSDADTIETSTQDCCTCDTDGDWSTNCDPDFCTCCQWCHMI